MNSRFITSRPCFSTGPTQEDRPDIAEKLLTGTFRIKSNKLRGVVEALSF